MGNSCVSKPPAPTQTQLIVTLARQVQQAGSAVKGKIRVVLGEAQRDMFRRFNRGALISVRLLGEEKVYWASGQQHNPQANKAVKHLVDGGLRREKYRQVIDEEVQVRKVFMEEFERSSFAVEVPFSIPLPADLPPSLYYCGEMMSCLSVQYLLMVKLVGLQAVTGATDEARTLVQTEHHIVVRELDPPPQAPLSVQAEGKVTGAFGLFEKGNTRVEGQLLTPRACQNSEAMVRIAIDNSACGQMVALVNF